MPVPTYSRCSKQGFGAPARFHLSAERMRGRFANKAPGFDPNRPDVSSRVTSRAWVDVKASCMRPWINADPSAFPAASDSPCLPRVSSLRK
jgi:hypothetical protein